MKAMMMRVNYDPRYITPHRKRSRSPVHHARSIPDTVSSRLAATSRIYSETYPRRNSDINLISKKQSQRCQQDLDTPTTNVYTKNNVNQKILRKQHVFSAMPLIDSPRVVETPKKLPRCVNNFLEPISMTGCPGIIKKSDKSQQHEKLRSSNTYNKSVSASRLRSSVHTELTANHLSMTSRLLATSGGQLTSNSGSQPSESKRLFNLAFRKAEKAIREKKIFVILGPYDPLRQALSKRGWVEKLNDHPKFSRVPQAVQKYLETDDHRELDDIIRDFSKNHKTSWITENSSIHSHLSYLIESHIVRNKPANFIFSIKTIHPLSPTVHQMVNHFRKNNAISTKIGLSEHLRNSIWFNTMDHDQFFPRCYRIDDPEEQAMFIDDFKTTACVAFLKCFVSRISRKHQKRPDFKQPRQLRSAVVKNKVKCPASPTCSLDAETLLISQTTPSSPVTTPTSRAGTPTPLVDTPMQIDTPCHEESTDFYEVPCTRRDSVGSRISIDREDFDVVKMKGRLPRMSPKISLKWVGVAMSHCKSYLRHRQHRDIDSNAPSCPGVRYEAKDTFENEDVWMKFSFQYKNLVTYGAEIEEEATSAYEKCRELLRNLRKCQPQFDIDGHRDIWIVKPGAMSRGRGIQCHDDLATILYSVVENECSYVVQKYIERPMLIYKTKFDIRQWFLVTCWKPLTIWFYNDCYIRFCSQEFHLNDFHEAIHLSNNSIQKSMVNGERSKCLPKDNAWTAFQFKEYLLLKKKEHLWESKIIAGIKKIILCACLCTQDNIENRKNAFEIYGADFMLSDNLQPWLLEINSSPTMACSTVATDRLVTNLMDDIVKVTVDRKYDKNSSTGKFELLFKQQNIPEPSGVDKSMLIVGQKVKQNKPNIMPIRKTILKDKFKNQFIL